MLEHETGRETPTGSKFQTFGLRICSRLGRVRL